MRCSPKRARHFHELENLDRLATAVGPQRQSEGGGAFSFAVAGVDDHKALALTLGFFVGFVLGRGFNLHGIQDSVVRSRQ